MAIFPFETDDTRGLVGMHANSEEWNSITRLASGVEAAPIGMGQPVARVAGNDAVVAQWAAGDALGITIYRHDVDDETGFPEGANVPIMTMGIMWVAAGGTCTAGSSAGYDPATDRWGDADETTYFAINGCEFDTNAAAGALVKLRINRPAA